MTEKRHGISQFMWGYQPRFRRLVEGAVEWAFEAIGFQSGSNIILVGFKVVGNHAFDVCVEPEDGPYGPADFVGVSARAEDLYRQNPESEIEYSSAHVHEARHRTLRDEMRAKAVAEVFQAHPAGQRRTFFASRSTRVSDYEVHVVLDVTTDALAKVSQLRTTSRDRSRITPSLVHALIDEVLRRASTALHLPEPGAGSGVLGASTPEVVRSATEKLVWSVFLLAGMEEWCGDDTDLLLNGISALPYEGRAGSGNLVLATPDDPAIDVSLTLRQPVNLRETRSIRKLMEASGPEADLLVGEGKVYGLGRVAQKYDETNETVFRISVLGRGAWDLSHADQPLLSVRDGVAHLPVRILEIPLFEDLVDRLLPDANLKALIDLARAAEKNDHGAMLVISSDAAGEAKRFYPQAWAVEPTLLSAELLRQLTSMDGAVLVDPQGRCHAIGVILDGRAAGQGDPARGSRFNNAIRYLGTNPPPVVVVVYSADGSIDILPGLHPRVERDRVASAVQCFLDFAAARPPKLEDVYRAWDVVKGYRFYLSEEQCRNVNSVQAALNEWRWNNHRIQINKPELRVDPRMGDSYWIE